MTYLVPMNQDRIIGYFSLAALVLFAAASVTLVVQTFSEPVEVWRIRFDNVGSLRIEDPVRTDGIDVATITSILSHPDGPLVTVAFPFPPTIHANYSLRAVDVGVMGERLITLDCGTPDHPQLTNRDTLAGMFVRGPSEALGVFDRLYDFVVELYDVSTRLRYGTPERPSLIEQYNRMGAVVDSLSSDILAFVRIAHSELEGVLKTTGDLTETTATATAVVTRHAAALSDTVVMVMAKTESAIHTLDTMTTFIHTTLARLQQEDHTLQWSLLLDKADTAIDSLRERLNHIATQGIALKVHPRRDRGAP